MAEWFMALVLKTSVGASLPWVRILLYPPNYGMLSHQGVVTAWKATGTARYSFRVTSIPPIDNIRFCVYK